MDLAVGKLYKYEKPYDSSLFVDPYKQSTIDAIIKEGELPNAIPPYTRLLLCTRDVIQIPDGCFGLVGLRSTWARLGLIAPATFADPGFRGYLTLEVFNASAYPIYLRPGDKIWSLNLVPAINEPLYQGRYQDQTGVTHAKALYGDSEKDIKE